MKKRCYRPVIPILISLIAGIAVGNLLPGYGAWAMPGVPIGLALLTLAAVKKKTAAVTPLALFAVLGCLLIQPWTAPRLSPGHIAGFADAGEHRITGVLENDPVKSGNRTRFVLKAESLERNGSSFVVTGKVRVTVFGVSLPLSAGDRVCVTGKIKSIRNFHNPGGFDYKRHMAFQGILVTTYADENRVALLQPDPSGSRRSILKDSRRALSDFIARHCHHETGAVLKALIVGDKTGISPSIREAFNRSGTGHLLAISGLHIGIVATVAFVFFQWLLSRSRFFLWTAWTRKGAAIATVIPVLAYGVIAGMSPSTQRAVIMVVVFLMTFLFEREHDPINTLAWAALLILVVHPPALFSISFQLSFSAVLAILYGMSRVPSRENRNQRRVYGLDKVIAFFRVSCFAVAGTLPLVAFYFNRVSLVGLLANFIAVPLVGFLVTPLGLLAAFLYPLSAGCASVVLRGSEAVLALALRIVHLFSGVSFAAIQTVTPSLFEICCYYLLAWALLEMSGPKEGHARRKRGMIIAVVVFVAVCGDVLYWLDHRFWHKDLRVTVIDVGQGTSSLVEFPGGLRMLIDGGGFSDNAVFDVGQRIVAPLLRRNKINTVNTLVLSHPNADHLNGLVYIAENFNVKQIWTNDDAVDTAAYRRLMAIVEEKKISRPAFENLSRNHAINGVSVDILYPPTGFKTLRKKDRWRCLNNSSLVVRVGMGKGSFLFTGDIKAQAEKELLEIAGSGLQSTVLLAPHHGSRFSSTLEFLDRVDPEIVIVTAGWRNVYRFPHPAVLEAYKKRGFQVLRTDRNGAVTITTDGSEVAVRTLLEPGGG